MRLLVDFEPSTGLCNRFAVVAMPFYLPQVEDDLLNCADLLAGSEVSLFLSFRTTLMG